MIVKRKRREIRRSIEDKKIRIFENCLFE